MTSHIQIVLQARLESQRLPGKALLPIADVPMVVLSAERAARSGIRLVVATSDTPSDDPIARTCEAAGLSVFRGMLDNVYARFIGATADLDDDAIVVRLTADNVFPDADLIEALVSLLYSAGAAYAAPDWPDSGLPYGVVAEAFQVGALRRFSPESSNDAEHVTPALMRAGCRTVFRTEMALSHLRATVDALDDYSMVRQVFDGVPDPVAIGWKSLCGRLAALPRSPRASVTSLCVDGQRQSQLTLGTAQFGMPYGVANSAGSPSPAEISRMVHRAIDHGVTHIDTARMYGESEARVGAALAGGWRHRVSLITKLAPIEEDHPAAVRGAVDASIFRSCHALRSERLDTVLLHRAATRHVAGGAAWQRLLELKREGVIGHLGVSVQSPEEFAAAGRDLEVDALQFPFNVLDHRWNALPPPRANLVVYARSILLQGLLSGVSASVWPRVSDVRIGEVLATLESFVREFGRRSMADLAIAFARAHSWIHSLVIGMETDAQLVDNLALFAAPALDQAALVVVRRRLPKLPDALLDPARWPAS